jgi:hypothetical protein
MGRELIHSVCEPEESLEMDCSTPNIDYSSSVNVDGFLASRHNL